MSKLSKAIVYSISTITLLGVGVYNGRHYLGPKTAYRVDLNGDNKEDLVLKDRYGVNLEFLIAPKDDKGPYKSLDAIEREQLEGFNKKQEERRTLIEGRFKNIK